MVLHYSTGWQVMVTRQETLHQQIQGRRWLRASKHECNQCRFQTFKKTVNVYEEEETFDAFVRAQAPFLQCHTNARRLHVTCVVLVFCAGRWKAALSVVDSGENVRSTSVNSGYYCVSGLEGVLIHGTVWIFAFYFRELWCGSWGVMSHGGEGGCG